MSSNQRWRWVLLVWACIIAVSAASAYVLYKDDSDIYVIKWQQSPITMQVKLSATPGLSDGSSQRSSVTAAMDAWNPLLGTAQLTAVGSTSGAYATGNGINEIVMDSRIDGDAFPSGALAITIGYTSGNGVAESDIVFNSAYTWDSYRGNLRSDREDIRRVAVHELGHVLGLDHPDEHAQYANAIMNSRVSAVETPQSDDIAGVQLLYGPPGVRPTNDAFADAASLTLNGVLAQVTGSNIGATRETSEPAHAGSTGVHSVWWRWTATSNGTLTLTTEGSNFDTVLAAYTGVRIDALVQVAANDDAESPEQNPTASRKRTSQITVDAVQGTTYSIAVDGWGDADGTPTGYTGSITLRPKLDALIAPVITQQPANASVWAGGEAIFVVNVTGSPEPTLRWQRRPSGGTWSDLTEGGPYSGTTTQVLKIATTFAMNGDQFRCVVTNRVSSVTSSAATLEVGAIPLPVIRTQPAEQTLGVDDTVVLSVEADQATSYQWYRDDMALSGQTTATLVIQTARTNDSGTYHVVVTNAGGSVTSSSAKLTVLALPIVTNQGALRQVVAMGQTATLAVTASGSGALAYQWYHDGWPVPGANAPTYARLVSAQSDGGAYWAAVIDDQGTRHGTPFFVVPAHTNTNVVGWGALTDVPTGLNTVVSGGVGWDGALALKQDGTAASWGNLQFVQWWTAAQTENIAAVAIGRLSAAALKADGTVIATGWASQVPPGLKRVAAIVCGEAMVYALKTDGTITCWGAKGNLPAGLREVAAIGAGAQHALALKRDGTVVAWGTEYAAGQSIPVPAGLGNARAVAAGAQHSMALKADGTVVEWSSFGLALPAMPAGLRDVVAIAAGNYHSLALKADGTVVSWGDRSYVPDPVPSGLGSVFAIAAGGGTSLAIRDLRGGEAPLITKQPRSEQVSSGSSTTVKVAASSGLALGYRWEHNGVAMPEATSAQLVLGRNVADAGLYQAFITDGTWTVASELSVVGVMTYLKVLGSGQEIGVDVHHPNGNIFDQVLATGSAEAVTADWQQITRTSFIDMNGDIVQVEFSGPGTLTVVLDRSSGPATPVNYSQSEVTYMKGHAGLVVVNATEDTHLSVFTVGRATAFDPTGTYDITKPISATNDPTKNRSPLFVGHEGTAYDGIADLAFIAIYTGTGRFGGVRCANAAFFATNGHTGIYAPGVTFTGPVYVGDISAYDGAKPVLMLGSASDVRITGGDMQQANGQPVQVSGIARLRFTAGSDSHGHTVPAQINRATYEQNGSDVTTQIVVNP